MLFNLKKFFIALLATTCGVASMSAEYPIEYRASMILNAGNTSLAPYYISALEHGVLTQSKSALLRGQLWHTMDTTARWAYSYGVDFVTGETNKTPYDGYSIKDGSIINRQKPAAIWLQQLYADVKYRSLLLSVGMKERESEIVDFELSTGDVVESGNARPIPQVRAGFVDFQNIPFTNGWLQIMGEIAYGKFYQNGFIEQHSHLRSSSYCLSSLYHYKQCYFRTNPEKPFSATFGGQFVCLFGGTTYHIGNGVVVSEYKNRENLKAFWQAFWPRDNGIEGYFEGGHLGSWDIALRYRLRNGAQFRAYVENLWEDGSGMGKLNGWDGLWGFEYKAAHEGWLSGVVVEIIDWTNQGGPIHWDPKGNVGTDLTKYQATGGDNYYNNGYHMSYANFGMAIGNPFNKEPLYNLNGSNTFNNNRVRGWHIAANGKVSSSVGYKVAVSYRTSWGTFWSPALTPRHDMSVLAQANWKVPSVKGLDLKMQFALDRGSLYGDVTGGCLTVSYSGIFNFKK